MKTLATGIIVTIVVALYVALISPLSAFVLWKLKAWEKVVIIIIVGALLWVGADIIINKPTFVL